MEAVELFITQENGIPEIIFINEEYLVRKRDDLLVCNDQNRRESTRPINLLKSYEVLYEYGVNIIVPASEIPQSVIDQGDIEI